MTASNRGLQIVSQFNLPVVHDGYSGKPSLGIYQGSRVEDKTCHRTALYVTTDLMYSRLSLEVHPAGTLGARISRRSAFIFEAQFLS